MKIKPFISITKNSFNFIGLSKNFVKNLAIFLIICQFTLLFVNFSHQFTNHSHQNQYQIKSDFDSKKNHKEQHHCFLCFLNQFFDFLILNNVLLLNLALILIKFLIRNLLILNLPKARFSKAPRAPPIFV